MSWSDLQPPVRLAIMAGAFLLAIVLIWTWFVSPMRAREAAIQQDVTTAESQLEAMEREIESIPPATDAERGEWRRSEEELLSRLGPESEVPLLMESLVRLAESQGVEVFLTSGGAPGVQQRGRGRTAIPQEAMPLLNSVPGASFLPLDVRVFGDYAAISRFVSQVGRLGWVIEVAGLSMTRNFPEVVTDVNLRVFFRPVQDESMPGAAGAAGARGGQGNG